MRVRGAQTGILMDLGRPARRRDLPSAGEQHNLRLPALHEVNAATAIESDGFAQIASAGMRLRSRELNRNSWRQPDQHQDAKQDATTSVRTGKSFRTGGVVR